MDVKFYRGIIGTFLLLISLLHSAYAGEVVFKGTDVTIGKQVEILEDTSAALTIDEVNAHGKFTPSFEDTPNFGVSASAFWVRLNIRNNSAEDNLFLELAYPRIESVTLYSTERGKAKKETISWNDAFDKRHVKHQNIVFKLDIPRQTTQTYYLRIHGSEQIVVPLIVRSEMGLFQFALTNEIISGIHIGVLLVMMLYNFFVYFSIREKSYLYYVLYILFIGLTQTTITGYTFKFLWPGTPAFNEYSIILFPALAGSFALLFFQNFLHIRERSTTNYRIITAIIVTYGVAVLFNLIGLNMVSYRIIDLLAPSAALFALVVALMLSMEGYRPAKFFLVAWSMFLIGIVLYSLRNLNILPYNSFTNYTMQAGTAIEVILLSFALADKINIFKRRRKYPRRRRYAFRWKTRRSFSNRTPSSKKASTNVQPSCNLPIRSLT